MSTTPKRPKTDHAAAVRCMEKGWGQHKSREDFYNSLRYKGVFTLPKKTLGQTPKAGVS
jgi:hypothetical protein